MDTLKSAVRQLTAVSRALPALPRSIRCGGAVACAVVVLAASVAEPGDRATTTLFGVALSVYLHVVAYAGLTGAVGYALLRYDRRALVAAAAVALTFGVVVELVQGTLSHRAMSTVDALVNAAGAALGAGLWRVVAPAVGASAGADADGVTTSI